MIDLKNLTVSYARDMPNIISNMNLNIKEGSILCVLGQNGVGKTTLMRCITKEFKQYSGEIFINNKNIKEYSIKEYSETIGVVSSHSFMYQDLIVAEYLMTGYANTFSYFRTPKKNELEKIILILEYFGKEYLFNKSFSQLSSGEKQIVMIARTILQNPRVILFDEPMANLDVRNQVIVLEQICRLRDRGYTIIMTTHNPSHAIALNGQVLLMGKNKYLFGTIDEIITDEILSQYYELPISISYIEGHKSIIINSINNKDISFIL